MIGDAYMFKCDLKSGYRFIDINENFASYSHGKLMVKLVFCLFSFAIWT